MLVFVAAFAALAALVVMSMSKQEAVVFAVAEWEAL